MDATTYKDEAVIRETGQVVPVKVNAEKDGIDVAKKYDVHNYPTILFIDPSGAVVYKMLGYLPAKPFISEVKVANEVYRKLPSYQAKLARNPNDLWTMERLAMIYAKQEKADLALPLIQKAEAVDPKGQKGALSDAYDAMGNYLQNKGDNAGAEPMFEKAIATTKDDFILADATLSAAQCCMSLKQNDKAKGYLADLMKQPNAPDYYKKIADQMAKSIK